MPKLTQDELERRAQTLKSLYVKHKGNKSRIAKELGITPAAIDYRFNSPVGKSAKIDIQTELDRVAAKHGISLDWYIARLKEGIIKPSKIEKRKRTKDYAVIQKYLVTLGELMKYLKHTGDTKNVQQMFVIGDIMEYLKRKKDGQIQSNIEEN